MCRNDAEEDKSGDEGEPPITKEGELKQRTHKPKGGLSLEANLKTPLSPHSSSVGSREDGDLAGDRPEEVNQHVPVIATHRDAGRPKQATTAKPVKLAETLPGSLKPKVAGTV